LTLHEIPPNGQGIAALQMLGILEYGEMDVSEYPVDSVDSIHLQIEAMKLAFADTHCYVSDGEWMEFDPRRLLHRDYLSERAELIDMDRAQNPGYGVPESGGTVYLTTADESGMMVSYIQSNYMGFGSGIVIPGTGISMQNRGAGFSLEEGHPNQVDGGKRPFHTIIPAFVTRSGSSNGHGGGREPVMSFGVMGGPMQPQGHAQLMVRMFDHHQNPQTAMDAPRWQVFPDMEVAVEPGITDELVIGLSRKGHRITRDREFWWFGGAQAICRLGDGYCAGSDSRKDGMAIGF
jgi:gamma-glutamyltranspeptidase/glutathione hydrolase